MKYRDVHEEEGSPLLHGLWRTNGTANGFRDRKGYPPLYRLVVFFEMAFIEDGAENADA